MQQAEKLLEQCRRVSERARTAGADESVITLSQSAGVQVEWRDGRAERVGHHTQQRLRMELFVEGRYSASATSDLRPEAVDRFIEDAVALTRHLEPDPHRGPCAPECYARDVTRDLDLFDTRRADWPLEERLACAEALEARVADHLPEGSRVSIQTSCSDSEGRSARVHSNGFEACRRATRFALGASAVVRGAGEKRPAGASYSARRHREDLRTQAELAREAAERGLSQLETVRIPTARYTVVVENHAMPRLLGTLLAPLRGPLLQQGQSLYEGRIGDAIASPLLEIWDDPARPRGLASALWDDDGLPAERRPIVEAGVLRTFLIDQYYARKLGVAPTGGSLHNLEWKLGESTRDELLSDVADGLYVERFLGGNSSPTSGALSFGCAGRIVRDGKLAESFAEANLSGDVDSLFRALVAVGNDPDPDAASGAPSCVFEAVQMSGAPGG